MFVLSSNGRFYTGRAGEGWVSTVASEAFAYETHSGAMHKADTMNKFSKLHGEKFEVEAAR